MTTRAATARPDRSAAGFDLAPPSDAEMARLTAGLTPEERRVLLDHGTERPFCGTDRKSTRLNSSHT